MKIAITSGYFDPLNRGHLELCLPDIVLREHGVPLIAGLGAKLDSSSRIIARGEKPSA